MSTTVTALPPALQFSEESSLFQLLCERRGWSEEFLDDIESREHDELLDINTLVEALEEARMAGKQITIAPDFDMDGISSGVLGYAGLSELGFNVQLYLPDYRRGHDLTPEAVQDIHKKWPGTQILLTCDSGVNSHDGIAAARDLGWTTWVTDHHQELPPGSTADITVNPCRMDETYANSGICGAHVLYQVLETYTRVYRPEKTWEIRLLRLFAGIGTVSDVMPILWENRQLVRDSLSIARLLWVAAPQPNGPYSPPEPDLIDVRKATLMQLLMMGTHHPVYLRAFAGFALMLKAFTQTGKIRDIDSIDEGFYGFYLAPAMNSPRRINTPLDPCFEIFINPDGKSMLAFAHQILEGNERRKKLVIDYMEEISEGDQPLAPWVYFSAAPGGMFGLLASKLMEESGHPVVVMGRPVRADEPVAGSGRAPAGFRIIDTLEPHPGMFAIGHQQACGVKVERADRLGDLVTVLSTATQIAALEAPSDEVIGDLLLGPDYDCDADLNDMSQLFELVRRTETLRPFGHAFTEPTYQLAIQPLSIMTVERIGADSNHIRMITRGGLICLWWNAAEEYYRPLLKRMTSASRNSAETLRFLAKLQINTFRGEDRIQAVIDQPLQPL